MEVFLLPDLGLFCITFQVMQRSVSPLQAVLELEVSIEYFQLMLEQSKQFHASPRPEISRIARREMIRYQRILGKLRKAHLHLQAVCA